MDVSSFQILYNCLYWILESLSNEQDLYKIQPVVKGWTWEKNQHDKTEIRITRTGKNYQTVVVHQPPALNCNIYASQIDMEQIMDAFEISEQQILAHSKFAGHKPVGKCLTHWAEENL